MGEEGRARHAEDAGSDGIETAPPAGPIETHGGSKDPMLSKEKVMRREAPRGGCPQAAGSVRNRVGEPLRAQEDRGGAGVCAGNASTASRRRALAASSTEGGDAGGRKRAPRIASRHSKQMPQGMERLPTGVDQKQRNAIGDPIPGKARLRKSAPERARGRRRGGSATSRPRIAGPDQTRRSLVENQEAADWRQEIEQQLET